MGRRKAPYQLPLPSEAEAEVYMAWYTGDWTLLPRQQRDFTQCALAHWVKSRYQIDIEEEPICIPRER